MQVERQVNDEARFVVTLGAEDLDVLRLEFQLLNEDGLEAATPNLHLLLKKLLKTPLPSN